MEVGGGVSYSRSKDDSLECDKEKVQECKIVKMKSEKEWKCENMIVI